MRVLLVLPRKLNRTVAKLITGLSMVGNRIARIDGRGHLGKLKANQFVFIYIHKLPIKELYYG